MCVCLPFCLIEGKDKHKHREERGKERTLRHTSANPRIIPSMPAAARFVTRLAVALHRYGVPSHRLEGALEAVARRLGVRAQFFVTPTALMIAHEETPPRTELIRTEPGEVDLGRMAALDRIAQRVVAGQLTLEEGERKLQAVLDAPDRYPAWAAVAAFALSSACAARFLGGGGAEAALAAAIGLPLGALAAFGGRLGPLRPAATLIAALAAEFLAALATRFIPAEGNRVALAALIVYIPGLTFTVAMNELAMRHLASGTSRFAAALITFLQLGIGVAIGDRLGALIPGLPIAPVAGTPGGASLALALVAAPLSLVVLFGAARRDLGWIVLACLAGFFGARAGGLWLGPELGVFCGALVVGMAGNLFANWRRRPAAVLVVPGLMILVPGSLGARAVAALLNRQVVSGIETAFAALLIAVALAAGLLVAGGLVPARRAL